MGFIFGCFLFGIVLAFFIAPIVMFQNAKHLKEMDRLIREYSSHEYATEADSRAAIITLKLRLVEIKGKIVLDKKAIEQARDKMLLINEVL